MKPAKFKLVFDRLKETRKKPEGLIQIECYRKGFNRVWISTGVKVKAGQWNEKRAEVTRHPNQIQINIALRKILDDFQRYEMTEYGKGIIVPLVYYKELMKSTGTKLTFLQFFEKEFNENPNYAVNTRKKYNSALGHLLAFKKIKYFSDINYSTIQAFSRHLISEGLNENSVNKYMSALRHMVYEAMKRGLIDRNVNPFNDFKIKRVQTKTECLLPEEIAKLETLQFNDNQPGLEKARDMFLFCVYTGLRFSDLQQLSNKTVKFEINGVFIDLVSVKTKKPKKENLALYFKNKSGISRPEAIMHKYKDMLRFEPFKVSLQPYNRKLKKIAKLAGIEINLTSHVARGTFTTFMSDKVSMPVLQELVQHGDIRTTSGYVNIKERTKINALENVNWD
ncbi:MAG: site-specific integrase [Bacteroidetes bacterium]|nr:site-specific integrase [Bacteroidota bacterium]